MTKPNFTAALILLAILVTGSLIARLGYVPAAPPVILNPGFEPDESGDPLRGWTTAGVPEPDPHTGANRLTHPGSPVPLESHQTLTGISNGWYTLKAWVRSSGGQDQAFIALTDCGPEEARAAVPIVREDLWLQIAVSARVTRRECTIRLVSQAAADEWVSFDDVELVPGRAALTVMGADVSSLYKSEFHGGEYAYADGRTADALEILSRHGMNYARLRVWVDSPDGFHGKSQLLDIARRLKNHGIKLLVDFHYADSWADPGKQPKPAAWQDLDFEGLVRAVYDHTFDVCSSLKEQGTPPDMMQIGNEINNGMLWPDGRTSEWDNLAALLKAGQRAVKDCSPSTQVMLHLAEGGDNELYREWFDQALQREVPFDLIGASYYPFWHGNLHDLQTNLNDIALRYDKDIIVVETAYPFTYEDDDGYENVIRFEERPGYPFTPEGQARMLADIMSLVRAIPGGHGLGVVWWDATWTAVPGNGWDPARPTSGNNWENQALFDYNHRALPALDLFRRP